MTELAPTRRAPRPAAAAARRRPRIWPTIAAAVASFAVLFEFLAFQLSSGNDPAIGSLQANAPKAQAAQPVLNRRIVKTRVVHLPPEAVESDDGTVVAPADPSVSAPVTSTPAPVVSTPAPAPAPAPAAPVTSSS